MGDDGSRSIRYFDFVFLINLEVPELGKYPLDCVDVIFCHFVQLIVHLLHFNHGSSHLGFWVEVEAALALQLTLALDWLFYWLLKILFRLHCIISFFQEIRRMIFYLFTFINWLFYQDVFILNLHIKFFSGVHYISLSKWMLLSQHFVITQINKTSSLIKLSHKIQEKEKS